MAQEIVGKAISLLGDAAYAEVESWWYARDDLQYLKETLRKIKDRLADAERDHEGERGKSIKGWLGRLRLVSYRIEDLVEEVQYRDHERQQMQGNLLAKICFFFSWYGPLCLTFKVSREIKSIKRELDVINLDMDRFGLIVLPSEELPMTPLIKERATSSVVKEEVIGRENDKNKIIKMLCDSKYDEQEITVIPIVGFGGVGKTTLAKLVFNDEEVQQHFDLTGWAYVHVENNNLNKIEENIFRAFFPKEDWQNRTPDYIERRIIQAIANQKYLLVLDDLWTRRDDQHDLTTLLSLLKRGKRGSKVILTTRLDEVAKHFVPIEAAHRLKELTDDQSWELFKNLAFRPGQESSDPGLSTIGKDIVKMCGNMPLAINVVGGSLRSKHTQEEWLRVKSDLSKAQLPESRGIMVPLKISYDYLQPVSKLCFAHCSLFPKGYEFKKDELVHLWMAQGYVEPHNGDQYFSDLVARNLFQDMGYKIGVRIYKMHDLLHDLAQEVAGDESMMYEHPDQIHDQLVHVNLNRSTCPPSLKDASRLRSLLNFVSSDTDDNLFSEFHSLRVLSITDFKNLKLANHIGRLIHLRYLELEGEIPYLPDSISRLVNLQTLHLQFCSLLKELPQDFAKLVNLRHLLLPYYLSDLPPGFEKLTSLQQLNTFIVGKDYGIDTLGTWNLREKLSIHFRRWRSDAIKEVKRANLNNNHQLTTLVLVLRFEEEECTPAAGEMNKLLRCMQLPSNLKHMRVYDYRGDEVPARWLDGLSQLVSIEISRCRKCKVLPNLSGLPHLKRLVLWELDEMEYVEDNIRAGTATDNGCFFPSLEFLDIYECNKLKGWTRASKDEDERRQLVFPCLLNMRVLGCRMLMSMPLAPKLESLVVRGINWKIIESKVRSNDDKEAASSSSTPPSLSTLFTSLKKLEIYRVNDGLISLSISSSLCKLSTLNIGYCLQLRNVRFESPNSIRVLQIEECSRLKNLSEDLQHLSKLEELRIFNCVELELEEEEQQQQEERKSGSGWQGLSSLRQLVLDEIPQVKSLPRGIACVTTLRQLYIHGLENLTEIPEEIDNLSLLSHLWIWKCPKLKSLPSSIQNLVSLQTLSIKDCPDLARKNMPEGQDWHLIQHVSNLFICDGLREHVTNKGREPLTIPTGPGVYLLLG